MGHLPVDGWGNRGAQWVPGPLKNMGAQGAIMNDDLFAALRDGVNEGSVPTPISGESINDYRFRVAPAGALIGIKWVTDTAAKTAEAAAEAAYLAALDDDTSDTTGQGWRHGDSTVTSPGRPYSVPPEQNEVAGV